MYIPVLDNFFKLTKFESRFDVPTRFLQSPMLKLEWTFGLLTLLSIFFLMVQYQDDLPTVVKLIIFGMMTLTTGAFTIGKHLPFLQASNFGKPLNFALSIIGGVLIALFFASQFSVLASVTTFTVVTVTFIIMVGFVAPLAEEWFFRSLMWPTATEIAKSPTVGIVVTALSFSAFHLFVYGINIATLGAAFLFSVLMCLLAGYTRSSAGTFVAHILINTKVLGLW